VKKKAPPKTELPELLSWVQFLREHGHADAVERKAKMARELLADMDGEARRGRRDHYTAMFFAGGQAEGLSAKVALARKAEKELKRFGWRMNEAGKVTRIRAGIGADLLAECVWEIYSKEHARDGNTLPVRQKIAAALAPYFDADELSTKSKAPLYMAIYNREYRRL